MPQYPVGAFCQALEAQELRVRVANRFRIAKGGISLLPDYERALEALENGDVSPIREFGRKVKEIIIPGGGNAPADWFWALGVAKRNALKTLYRQIGANDGYLSNADLLKSGMLTYAVREVQGWAKAIRTLELASAVGDAEREIKHGPFIIVPVPGVTKAQQDGALEALDAASEKIRAKFPKVLYGKIFLARHLSKKTAAHYIYTDDTFHLNVQAKKRFDDIYTICHELGHRYAHKFLAKELKTRFWNLSTRKEYEVIKFDAKLRGQVADEVVFLAKQQILGKPLPKMSYELESWLRSSHGPTDIKRYMKDYLTYTIDDAKLHAEAQGTKDADVMTSKVLHGPLSVTAYGATSPDENWAEAFAHYVLGKDMAPELTEILVEAE